jgi:hypothetical protein
MSHVQIARALGVSDKTSGRPSSGRLAPASCGEAVQHDREQVRAIGRGAPTALQVHEALQREPVTTIPSWDEARPPPLARQ